MSGDVHVQFCERLWGKFLRATHLVIGCTGKQTAEDIWDKLPCRLIKFGLELSKEKCRLIEFGRRAYYQSKGGKKKLNTFDFLGFTHYMARSRRGGVKLSRKTIGRRMRKTLIVMNNKLREKRNLLPFRKLHTYLCRILNGYYNYYGFAGNLATLRRFEYAIRRMWYKWLNRRSHRKSFNWDQYIELLNRYPLPQPKILKGYNWIYSTNL